MGLTRWVKIMVGGMLGYSGCIHCKMPWRYVAAKKIMYSSSQSMSPLCIRCFEGLPIEKIDYYIKKLVRSWDLKKEETDGVIASARKEARRMKERLSARSLKIKS